MTDQGVGIFEGDSLIRATLHIDPDTMTDAEWIFQIQQAMWVEDYRVSRMARIFGGN